MTTIETFKLPWPLRGLNRAGDILSRLGVPLVSLSKERVLAAACRRTGLCDGGEDAGDTALGVLLESYERQAHLSLLGRMLVRHECVRLLANRLRIQASLRRHPAVLQTAIRRPLFIVSLQRTGTTLLHNLLAQDPEARVPLLWEVMWPSPLQSPEARTDDTRRRWTERNLRRLRSVAPQLFVIHPMDATAPEECFLLLQHALASPAFDLFGEVSSYLDWLWQQDMVPAYQYYRQLLQLLQWPCPGRHWVLKSPFHLFALDTLLTVFPDARIVQTHRDLAKVAASSCSLVAALRQLYCRQVDLQRLGARWLCTWGLAMDRALQARTAADPGRFYDVPYQELLADPIGTVHRLYAYFGDACPPAMDERMQRWLRAHPQHKHGQHQYSLECFGLDRDTVRRRFAAYMARFDVTPEA